MKPLTTVAVCGLVPVPPMRDTQACSDNDNQLLTADNAETSRPAVAWVELREIAWLAFIVIGLSILSVGAAVALAFAL
jgi:hypothetical protein